MHNHIKILAIASVGGHWIQLLRLKAAFQGANVEYVSTKSSFASMVPGFKFYSIPDSNRNNPLNLIKSFYHLYKVIKESAPDCIITTGASPGLIGIIIGKILRVKTIWVDSIANVDHLSLSGKIASKFADRVYTQWPSLENENIIYKGNVLE